MCAHGTTLFHTFFRFLRTNTTSSKTHTAKMDATEHTTLSSSQNIKEEYV